MAVATEKFRSIVGDEESREIGYIVRGATGDQDAIDTVKATTPLTHEGLSLQKVRLDTELKRRSDTDGDWECTAIYSRRQLQQYPTGTLSYEFDFGLSSQQIYRSISTADSQVPSGKDVIEFNGSIGVDSDNAVSGVSKRVPTSSFAYTWTAPTGTITDSYQRGVQQIVGHVNSLTFKGYAAGSVLFTGASGSARSEADWSITYRFEYSPNTTNITIGGITVPSVLGWQALWVYYERGKIAGKFVPVPRQAQVENIYETSDFSVLAIP